jgi:RNA-directed DNA polymerase
MGVLQQQYAETSVASLPFETPTSETQVMERILDRRNLKRALKQVRKNKGAPGVDGMTVGQLGSYLRRHWPEIRQALMDSQYSPLPVRGKEIPKPGGGAETRLLGIPTVLDRFIYQAVNQVLQEIWDPTFSAASFGFRPGRSQWDAIMLALQYVRAGYRRVVDIDLSKFFDRVNHDRLMSRLAKRVKDKRVLKLIRAALHSGIMKDGLTSPTEEGVPQGSPLSPLLSNIVLDELDKELERRGLRFVRYADDFLVFVRSKKAAERVMASIDQFITGMLKLKINSRKSGIRGIWETKFLGFSFTKSRSNPKICIHWNTIKRLKARIREITGRSRGRSLDQVIRQLMEYLQGWWGYYQLAQSTNRLHRLVHWIRRRLRALVWKQWKNRRTRVRNLLRGGISRNHAVATGCSRKGPWHMSLIKWVAIALPNSYFSARGFSVPWATSA